jgi:hypothetical protein
MINKLKTRLLEFAGAPNRARCFTHILNLVVKSIMNQFDMPRSDSDTTDKRTHELYNLAGNIETEELETLTELEDSQQQDDDDEPGPCNDNDEGWVDERDELTQEDIDELEDRVQPIRVLLTKVSDLNN